MHPLGGTLSRAGIAVAGGIGEVVAIAFVELKVGKEILALRTDDIHIVGHLTLAARRGPKAELADHDVGPQIILITHLAVVLA